MAKKFGKVTYTTLPGGSAVSWDKPGQSVEGVYQGSRKVNTKNGETFIHLIEQDETVHEVWETFALQRLHDIPKGTAVRITFKGKQKIKGGRKLNVLVVEYDSRVSIKSSQPKARKGKGKK